MNKRKPNILVIMTDQHRWDYMSCLGSSPVPTPNIDRIAEKGVLFTNAYSPYPVCVASRMSFLTGQYAHTTGAITNEDHLDWRYRTAAHHFSDNGYVSGLIGKMHFGTARKHGFDYYMSVNDWLMYLGPKAGHYADEIASHPLTEHFTETVYDTGAAFPDVEHVWKDDLSPWRGHVTRSDFRTTASELDPEDHLDMFIARETVSFLETHAEDPCFAIAGFMKPHTPLNPPREWAERYPIEEEELQDPGSIESYPPHIQSRIKGQLKRDEHLRKAHKAGYHGNLGFADHCIGYMMDQLQKKGLLENTIVVYTSDHGEMDGEHGLFQKFCLFDPSVKVPLIVSFPGTVPEGVRTDALTEYIGLYPTLCELAGVPLPEQPVLRSFDGSPQGFDCRSFADICLDPSLPGPETIFSEYDLRGSVPEYMLRTKKYKYIYNDGSDEELYNLEEDPGETLNLAAGGGEKTLCMEMREKLNSVYNPEENSYKGTKGRAAQNIEKLPQKQ